MSFHPDDSRGLVERAVRESGRYLTHDELERQAERVSRLVRIVARVMALAAALAADEGADLTIVRRIVHTLADEHLDRAEAEELQRQEIDEVLAELEVLEVRHESDRSRNPSAT